VRAYHVYILSSLSRCIYIGVTSDLRRRLAQHKRGAIPGFTKQYRVTRLVHFEEYESVTTAITREKQLKRWPRARKNRLIERDNPSWDDLAASWRLDESFPPAVAKRTRVIPQSRIPLVSSRSRVFRSCHRAVAHRTRVIPQSRSDCRDLLSLAPKPATAH
jgi:putative endonuclease